MRHAPPQFGVFRSTERNSGPTARLRCRSVSQLTDNVTIVIVEDHVALRRGLELLLRDTECKVIGTADDAEAAEALVERRLPDVAIVDISLPGKSGIDLTRSLLA